MARPFESMPSTHWSLVRRAGVDDETARREALGELLRRYLPALRLHLTHSRRIPADRADDLLQGFVADKILERQLLTQATETRGKFRTFLLTSLSHYVISQHRHDTAQKRGGEAGVSLEGALGVADTSATPDEMFDAAWARTLVTSILHRMQRQCAGRPDVWAVFESRVLPQMHGEEGIPYEELVAKLKLESPAQAANLLTTAKRLYVRLLREAIGEYEPSDEGIDEELRDLRTALAGVRAA